MAGQLNRSISTNQCDRSNLNASLRRSVSCNGTRRDVSHGQGPATDNMSGSDNPVKYCLLDAEAEIEEFIKLYVLYWNMRGTKIVLRYNDAVKRLPKLSARLDKCKLQSLSLVKNTLKSIRNNLVKSLKPSSQKEQLLPALLERAEHATDNAMMLCVNSDPNFQFENCELKDISQCSDIMSAAMLMQNYLTNVANNIGKLLEK